MDHRPLEGRGALRHFDSPDVRAHDPARPMTPRPFVLSLGQQLLSIAVLATLTLGLLLVTVAYLIDQQEGVTGYAMQVPYWGLGTVITLLTAGLGVLMYRFTIDLGRAFRLVESSLDALRRGDTVIPLSETYGPPEARQIIASVSAFRDLLEALKRSRDDLERGNERLRAELQQRIAVEHKLQNAVGKLEAEQESLAFYDQLTGLPNRALFMNRLAHEIEISQRRGTPFAILFLDLDRFKYVNDTIGHSVGDRLLVEVGRRLNVVRGEDTLSRLGDTISRFGGDEFTFIVRGVDNPRYVVGVAERILAAFEQEFVIQDHTVQLSASLGIALSPGDGEDVETLIKHAEVAMYRAKELGGKQYRYFETGIEQRVNAMLSLNDALRRAIERKEFVLHYQPVVGIADRQVIYYEALVRWRREDGRVAMPAEFIEFAEETGLIVPIGRLVIDRACREARALKDSGVSLPISINVSAKQFQQDDIPARIKEALDRYDVDSAMLEIEITESALITDPQSTGRILQALTHLGVRIAIDDFGARHSSLNYLVDFPVSKVKIDQGFIRSALNAERNRVIVGTIVELGKRLGIQTVAEGVESEDQHRFLLNHGCDYGQGYLYGKPQAPEVVFGKQEPRR